MQEMKSKSNTMNPSKYYPTDLFGIHETMVYTWHITKIHAFNDHHRSMFERQTLNINNSNFQLSLTPNKNKIEINLYDLYTKTNQTKELISKLSSTINNTN